VLIARRRTIRSTPGDAAGLPRLLDALADDGFDASEIEAIAWGNWRRVLGHTWGESQAVIEKGDKAE